MPKGVYKRTEQIRKKLSESKQGNKNPSWKIGLPVNLDNESERDFSYLVGYWVGDGLKTGNCKSVLGFAVREDEIYINNLVSKASSILRKPLKYRYEKGGRCGLYFNSDTKILRARIAEELQDKSLIKKHPWHFITGFLDSDGWVSYWGTIGNDKRNICICFANTNMNFLLLLEEILDWVLVPYSLSVGTEYLKGYKLCYTVRIATNAGIYLVSHKILPITVDKKKKEKCKEFISFFDEVHQNQSIPICETFTSIQGEGSNVGKIQFFIRAATCDMHCKICDSKYSWKKYQRRKKLTQLVEEAKASGVQSVCLTGGEIAQFRDRLVALVGMLRVCDFDIILQTNGLHYYRGFELIHTVSMDMKTPCTGEKSDESLIPNLKPKDEIKTLVQDMKDYEYSVKLNKLTSRLGIRHILQPLNLVGQDTANSLLKKYKWLCDMVVKDRRWGSNVRVIPQMHILLWGNERKR
jgi:7-carboxy-7-deazaguanine synthase